MIRSVGKEIAASFSALLERRTEFLVAAGGLSEPANDERCGRRRLQEGSRSVRRQPVEIVVATTDVLAQAQEVAGHQFKNLDLLDTALTHASVATTRLESNERLEFLGDAVLGLVICHELFRRYDGWLEGDLTKVKSVVVSRRICAIVSDEIGLTELLRIGNGLNTKHTIPMSVRAAVLESLIGALYVDAGLEVAERFILGALAPHLERCAKSETHDNFKSVLQQYAQRYLSATPQYFTLDEQGPDHSKCFEICVVVGGERFPGAWGTSKKEAEQEAARRALEILSERRPDVGPQPTES